MSPPKEKYFRDLVPLKELRATEEIVQSRLKELGWNRDWIDDVNKAFAEALERTMPQSFPKSELGELDKSIVCKLA